MAGVAVRIVLEVVLVLGLGLPEGTRGRNFGDDLARPQSRRLDIRDGVLRRVALRIAGVINAGPIARAPVVALPVERRGVMDLKEELEQLPIAQLVGIENNLDGLGVTAVVAVSRIGHIAP